MYCLVHVCAYLQGNMPYLMTIDKRAKLSLHPCFRLFQVVEWLECPSIQSRLGLELK